MRKLMHVFLEPRKEVGVNNLDKEAEKAKGEIGMGAFLLVVGLIGIYRIYIVGNWEVTDATSAASPCVSPIFVIVGIGYIIYGLIHLVASK